MEEENVLTLRPQRLDEYIGQEHLKEKLKIYIGAAKAREEPLDHVLFYGPPGLGKTSLAYVIANEMGAKLHLISGPSIEKPGDLAAILSELEPLDILFIDEIHRIPRIVEESLYSAMEDFTFNIIINNEQTSKTITIHLPPFTLIGATTRPGSLSSPLRERFGIIEKINFYTIEELTNIVLRASKVFDINIDFNAAQIIAERSRCTPRICIQFFKRIRDFSTFKMNKNVSKNDVIKMFKLLKVNDIGLNQDDIDYIRMVSERFNGGPVGINTLAYALGNEVHNIENVVEPFLLQKGLIEKTQKGRILTEKGKEMAIIFKNR